MQTVKRIPVESVLRPDELLYVSLFCGAGGDGEGALQAFASMGFDAAEGKVIVVNHDPSALLTHKHNHPKVETIDCDIERLDPRTVLKGRSIRALWQSSPCPDWSDANQSPYKREQKRATPEYSMRWVDEGHPEFVFEENVPGVMTKWEGWNNHVAQYEARGYRVEARVLDSANYGVPQNRVRMILIARRNGGPIAWPKQTHSKPDKLGNPTVPGTKPWIGAASILDPDAPCNSVFGRKKPLAASVRRRAARYVREQGRFWEPLAEAVERNSGPVRLADALAACPPEEWPAWIHIDGDGKEATMEGLEFVLGQHAGAIARDSRKPSNVVATAAYIRVGQMRCIMAPEGVHRGNVARSIKRPSPTLTASRGLETKVAEVRLIPVQPALLPHNGENKNQKPRLHRGKDPAPTQMATRLRDVLWAFVVTYNGKMNARSVHEPNTTVSTVERHALFEASVAQAELGDLYLDLGMRMLLVAEAARIQGFPDHYTFLGTKSAQQRHIGNAVPPPLAYAVIFAAFSLLGWVRTRIDDYVHAAAAPAAA